MITLTEGDCYHNSLPLMDPLESRLVLIPCLRTLGMQTYLSVGRWSRSTSRATAAPEQRLIRWCWVDKEGSGCCEKAVVSIDVQKWMNVHTGGLHDFQKLQFERGTVRWQ